MVLSQGCHVALNKGRGLHVQVWSVLTDYDHLPEVLPNLAMSEELPRPAGLPARIKRVRQVCVNQPYIA